MRLVVGHSSLVVGLTPKKKRFELPNLLNVLITPDYNPAEFHTGGRYGRNA